MRPDHPRQDRNVLPLIALALTMLVAGCNAASAAELAIPPRAAPNAPNVSMQAGPPNCARWTDDCINCARSDGAKPTCSNIGFACQPNAIRCLDAQ